jgi:hypothetical protein
MLLPERIYGGDLDLMQLRHLIAPSRAQRRSSEPPSNYYYSQVPLLVILHQVRILALA